MFSVTINLTDEQRERAERLAHQMGYRSSDEYLHALVENALEEDEDPTNEEIVDALKESLREMKRGEGMSADEFRRWMAQDD